MSRLKDTWDTVRVKKTVQPGKTSDLEKGDFTALLIAGFSIFGPVVLGMLVFFAAVIWILVVLFAH